MIARPVERSGRERVFGSSTVAETKPQRIAQALLTLHGDDGLDDLAWRDVAAGMPVDFREPGHPKFLSDRLSRVRARDVSAHEAVLVPRLTEAGV